MLSLIIPAHNEEGNILHLGRKIRHALKGTDHEVIFVDDGSTDGTLDEMEMVSRANTRIISLQSRKGKSAAIYEGIKNSAGDVIATMDADMQDDPSEIPRMLGELGKGYDMVCGWRQGRKDGPIKRVSSSIGNAANNAILKVGLHDNNCPLKVFRRECLSGMRYFDSMHRFIPALAMMRGYSVKEVVVSHHRRAKGKSKYGVRNRLLCNMKAMFMVKFRGRELFV
jgi:glycosyltransferase involved in cell wall biosynthesis